MCYIFIQALSVYKSGLHKEPQAVQLTIRQGVVYTYPQWAYTLGWFIAGGPIVAGLIYGAMHACAVVRGKGAMVSSLTFLPVLVNASIWNFINSIMVSINIKNTN